MCTVYQMYKCSRALAQHGIPILPGLIDHAIRFMFGAHIPHTASIGRNAQFGYGAMGIVFHDRTIIGDDCIISQQVTIGGRSGHYEVPVLGNSVFIGAGAKVLGPIKVGNNVSIGANAVVTHSIPDNCVVAGVPARIIKQKGNDLQMTAVD